MFIDLSNSPDALGNISLTPPLPPTSSSSVKTQAANNKSHNCTTGATDATSPTPTTAMTTDAKAQPSGKKINKQPATIPPSSKRNATANNNNTEDGKDIFFPLTAFGSFHFH